MLVVLFLVKIIAGIAYFQFYSTPQNKPGSDTWRFYNESVRETDVLLERPGVFVRDIFSSSYESSGGLFSDKQSHWNDLKDKVIIKLLAVINVFTGKNYYANIIFFNFLFFIGLVAFYRLVNEIYPGKKKLLIVAVFLLPSFLFWCSGIHKDGLVFSALGMIFYCFHRQLNGARSFVYPAVMIACIVLVFFLRNYLVFLLVCALLAGWLLHRFPRQRWQVLAALFVAGIALVFTTKYIHPSLDILGYVCDKQAQFLQLGGESKLPTPVLEPGAASFLNALPAALDAAFLRPHINERGIASLVAATEIIFFWLLFVCCLAYRQKGFTHPPVAWSCFIFAILALVVIGYTVPYSGAIVRYRALLLPLLLAPAIGGLRYITKKYI
jgi:hypothetical protein